MNKLLLATAAAALFMINSTAIGEDFEGAGDTSIAEAALKAKPAQQILNEMACKDKDPGTLVKDQTDGTQYTCREAYKKW